jgi:glucosamine kinase
MLTWYALRPAGKLKTSGGPFAFMAYFLGIDGGGTRTTVWLADERGRIVGRARSGPSNPVKVGYAAAQREILRAARAAFRNRQSLSARGQRDRRLEALCAGLAGADHPTVHRDILAWLRRALPARRHLLTTDAALVLEAALGRAQGIIVISGTGSIAFGRDAEGRVVRAGGWGIPYDDLGSGFDLGRRAIIAAIHDYDRRGPHTLLTERLRRRFRLRTIPRVVVRAPAQNEVAALFPLVLEAARQGDPVGRRLCHEAGEDLATLALTLIRRFGWRRRAFPVVCAGGVFKASAAIRGVFARQVRAYAPRAQVRLLRREPVEGALDLARQLGHQRVLADRSWR